jgi:membrane carboxypeptidase/penicillin-binding protein PbpC
MIGGDKTGKEGQVNATIAVNQVGSTLKPFLYLLAFQNL